jgi:hypothetical protein
LLKRGIRQPFGFGIVERTQVPDLAWRDFVKNDLVEKPQCFIVALAGVAPNGVAPNTVHLGEEGSRYVVWRLGPFNVRVVGQFDMTVSKLPSFVE